MNKKASIEKRSVHGKNDIRSDREERTEKVRRSKKMSEYGKQLEEKQRVKSMYGMLERQFRRWFRIASAKEGSPGDNLLSMLERRLDNVVYRLKLANTRSQARQIVVHGHILVNGKRVSAPSYWVSVNDEISLAPTAANKTVFLENVVDKRLNIGIKVPEWLELIKNERRGKVLRLPVRADIQVPIEDHLIVELYSK